MQLQKFHCCEVKSCSTGLRSWARTRVHANGNLMVGKVCRERLDFQPGNRFEIGLSRNKVTLLHCQAPRSERTESLSQDRSDQYLLRRETAWREVHHLGGLEFPAQMKYIA
ncbi:MAG: AbrB-like transcriptional regulator [Cyanobium sp.]